MKPLLFIIRKTIKNYIIQLKRKPIAFIAYLVMALSLLGFIIFSFTAKPEGNGSVPVEFFKIGTGALVFGIAYTYINQGIKKGESFFRMADINLAFTSPILPQTMLIYGFIKEMGTVLIAMGFLLFQIPNILLNFHIKPNGVLIIYVGVFLLFTTFGIMSIILYSVLSKNKVWRRNTKYIVNALLMILGGMIIINLLKTQNLLEALKIVLNGEFIYYIPLIGWFKYVIEAAVVGVTSLFWIYLGMIVAVNAIVVIVLYKFNVDFYEDVLGATEHKESMISAKKSGKMNMASLGKVRKVKQKNMESGAKAIFSRQMLEYRKSGYMFIDQMSLIMLGTGIIMAVMVKQAGIMGILFSSIYFLFFTSMASKWTDEMKKYYIYLIPDTSQRKLIYSILPQLIKNTLDGVILFVSSGIILKADPIQVILCIASYTGFGTLFILTDVMSRRIFGHTYAKGLKVFLRIFLMCFIIAPGIIGFVILYVTFKGIMGAYFAYLMLAVYNFLAAFVIAMFCKNIFDSVEMN